MCEVHRRRKSATVGALGLAQGRARRPAWSKLCISIPAVSLEVQGVDMNGPFSVGEVGLELQLGLQ